MGFFFPFPLPPDFPPLDCAHILAILIMDFSSFLLIFYFHFVLCTGGCGGGGGGGSGACARVPSMNVS